MKFETHMIVLEEGKITRSGGKECSDDSANEWKWEDGGGSMEVVIKIKLDPGPLPTPPPPGKPPFFNFFNII